MIYPQLSPLGLPSNMLLFTFQIPIMLEYLQYLQLIFFPFLFFFLSGFIQP